MERDNGGVVVMGRAQIDTRAPFSSVKEAVLLFGERVLVGEIYAFKLKQIKAADGSQEGHNQTRIGSLTAELEQTKQNLQKAKEESKTMAFCIKSLKEELEQTKKELQKMKVTESEFQKKAMNPEFENIKFIENEEGEIEKNRYVKFASPPSTVEVIIRKDEFLERPPSANMTKKKKMLNLIPLVTTWVLSQKKENPEK